MAALLSLLQPKQLIQLRSHFSQDEAYLKDKFGCYADFELASRRCRKSDSRFCPWPENEALRRLAFSQCRQEHGEKFMDFTST